MVITGQKKLREIYKNSPILQNTNASLLDNVTSIQENGSLYATDHNITIQIGDFDKPKKKRGRPKKVINDTPSTSNVELVIPEMLNIVPAETEEVLNGKRKRCAPRRFSGQIQGKELEKIFQTVDMIDDIDIDINQTKSLFSNNFHQNEEIGHIEHPDGEVTSVSKYKERNKGRIHSVERTCKICSSKFYSLKLYLAHVALHQTLPLESIDNLDLENHEQITEITETPILESLSLTDASIDINLDHNIDAYFVNGSSMPDISSDNNKNNRLDSSNSLLLDHTSGNLFSDSNIHDPVTELITSSIMPIATMPPGEMNRKEEEPPVLKPEIIINIDSKSKTQCSECGKMFNSKQSCNNHIKTSHRGERHFKCQQCGRSFGHSATLNKHALTHFPKFVRGFACDICGKVLRHPSSVLYHKESAHNDGHRFICKLCGKSFKHRQLLLRHQQVHIEDRPFSCKTCNSTFKTRATLMNHQKTHSGIKQFTCEICTKQFTYKNSLNQHMRLHAGIKPHKCEVCSKTFTQLGNMNEHMKTHTGEKPFECVMCGKKFASSSQYHLHQETHQEANSLKCQECGKQFYTKESFKNHNKRHKNEKPFTCGCGKSFVDRWTLRKHERLHTGEKPYTCDICNKSFGDSSNLVKHKKIHRVEETKTINTSFENTVLCMSYDNDKEPPIIHVVDESEVNNINTCELYGTESEILENGGTISINNTMASIPEVQSVDILDHFIDEDGNPIRFEGQNIVTSTDGKYLQLQSDEYVLQTEVAELQQTTNDLLVQTKVNDSDQTILQFNYQPFN